MLHIHRSERADGLVEALRELLAEPLPDVFAADVVAVPTRGMERWLAQQLSACFGASTDRSDGVCANVDFPSPRRLVSAAVATASGIDPEADVWLPERMIWPLLEVVDDCLEEPWLRTLAVYLGALGSTTDATRQARRLTSVRHLADLFDRYALHRPEMVRAWSAGEDTDGRGSELAPDVAWQAELWRRLNDAIPQPGPAERVEAACNRLEAEPDLLALPPRLSMFGLTRFPTGQLDVMRAISVGRDVHLFLLHPSPGLWQRVKEATHDQQVVRRGEDPTAALAANRVLASWGRDARELQLVACGAGDYEDDHRPVEPPETTLLSRLQSDVRADRTPPGPPLAGQPDLRPELDPDDRSLEVHACHGRARQVEVVRDAILHLLADDPTLEPRDVIVMCPDIETFAPLIQATFGAGDLAPEDRDDDDLSPHLRPPDLRVRLADRALTQTNPVLGVVARMLELVGRRLTASEVLDLADREPVRQRFDFDDDDLARLEDWVSASGIRWGLDAQHRAPFKLDKLEAGTWRAGLDRLLVGAAMSEDDQRLFAGVLPLDDVDSGSIELVGRFAEFVDRLQTALDALAAPGSIDNWAAKIAAAADSLTDTTDRASWQRAELQRVLEDVVSEAAVSGVGQSTSLVGQEVRALLGERLEGRPTRANFRTGHLTICTLVPMRSVPHRVVCLLGMDDGVFPRKAPRDGDDLMLLDPHVGERDPRSEDRQLLLDALMAATDRLIVTYTGNDERTNVPRPAAVPVGEFLDLVDATVQTEDGGARDQVLVRHPLQPFDPRNFTSGVLGRQTPWSFDRVTLDGARALAGKREEPRPFLAEALPPLSRTVIEVDDLVRFVRHPVRAFLRSRLGISLGDFSDEVDDSLPVELGGLEQWAVGERLLGATLGGLSMDAAIDAEMARGTLPPGLLARPVVARLRPVVEGIVADARQSLGEAAEARSVDVKVALPDKRMVSGTVSGLHADVLLTATYSRVNPRHRLGAWVRLLALTAARPGVAWEAVTVGRASVDAPDRSNVTVVRIPPLGAEVAARELEIIIDLWDRGMREPLPLACQTSAAYAQAANRGSDPKAAGRRAWESGWNRPKEDQEPEHQMAFGGVRTFAELLELEPRADEGWEGGDPTRLGRYARRLWAGLLTRERQEHR